MLRDKLRLERALPVAGRVDRQRAQVALDGFRRLAVAAVGGPFDGRDDAAGAGSEIGAVSSGGESALAA